MAEIVRMPKLSDTMTDGVVAEWHKKVGDSVESGELLAEIETDKATMEFESFQDGVLLHIGVEKGATAPVDSILAVLGERGEDIKKLIADNETAMAASKVEATPKAEEKTAPKAPAAEVKPAVSSNNEVVKPARRITVSAQATSSNGKVKASPLAKRLAKEKNINLQRIQGSGDHGRIIKRDIDNYSGGGGTFIGVEQFSEEPVSQMRKVIANRLSESKFTAPHFYLTIAIDMGEAMNARKAINKSIAPNKISFNDMVVKAVAKSLRKHPAVNSSWLGDRIRMNDHIHIGIAVAVDDGLLVPVVRFADGKSLSQIGSEVKDFASRARNKKLQPQDWEGNTFTISNLGMFGIEEFTAIINPPDACILAVGGIQSTPVVKDGQVVPGNVMKVTLSCDHRVVDGVVGSMFLNTLKDYLESPVMLLGEESI
ncbi:MAG: pyruvate dehydrogenase E2 component (dihydrolipoamide acetyltransferase) [Patiriisocius sp.]|jgi:pyruvate dehydrogenase E2 component (dihydrolipoamide acetyltransferase)